MFDTLDDPFRGQIDHGSFKNLYLEDYGRMKNRADMARIEGCAEGILAVAATLPMADA